MPVPVSEIYKLSRQILGREPDSPENQINYLELQNLDRSELINRLQQDTPASPEDKRRFYGEIGFNFDRSEILDEMTNLAADLAESYISSEEQALAEIGAFEFNEEAVRDEVLEFLTPYFEEQQAVLDRQIREGQIATREDFEFKKQQIEDEVSNRLQEISITEAENDEELQAKLTDIGASTSFGLSQARRRWDERIKQSTQEGERAGRSFSGVMKEELATLREARGEELGEIERRGGVQEQTAERTAKFTSQRAQAAREAAQALKTRETRRAQDLRARGERQFGTEGGEVGFLERERGAELARQRETLTLQELEARRQEQRQLHQMAREQAFRTAQPGALDEARKRVKL